jgi:acetyl-CoA carboxylase biotin carboxyl carrier protein
VTLTARDVAEITRLLEESSFDELYLEMDGLKLSLRRGGAAAGASVAATRSTAAPAPEPANAGTPPAAADPSLKDITAPLLGTFYRAPKPGAPPFVEVGSMVEEDTIVGIIEVMKLMNTVRAGARGRVTEILGRDGVLVEYGETLMRVSKVG